MEFNKQTVKALLGVVCGGIAFAAASALLGWLFI